MKYLKIKEDEESTINLKEFLDHDGLWHTTDINLREKQIVELKCISKNYKYYIYENFDLNSHTIYRNEKQSEE